MKETLVHTICAKCGKSVDLFMTSEQFKNSIRNESRIHCTDCFDMILAQTYQAELLRGGK